VEDEQFDCDYHVRHSALASPGRIRELLDLCGRLHGTRLALERPLWETHVIEGLEDGRVATYTKIHHALVDGVSSMRLLQSVLTTDPDRRDMPPPWAKRQVQKVAGDHPAPSLAELPVSAVRSAFALTAEAAGMPAALLRTLTRGVRNDTSALSLYAPRTIFNKPITGSRRFAAQSWDIARMRSVGAATSTTINDVVLAMCSGAVRRYLTELDALPDSTLVAMVPVGLKAKEASSASSTGGNAVGAVMVKLGTDVEDPAQRLLGIHRSMKSGKDALATMTPAQIMAMSAIGMAPAVLPAMLKLHGITRPPFNLIISNVPGPRKPQYFNGALLDGMWPLSIPIHGMALNITCTSYDREMGFGLTGCRRTIPHLQRLLVHLDDELAALEKAAGVE
jgi:diacylglycerol O-acyltransferase